jgi:hypothetical protein
MGFVHCQVIWAAIGEKSANQQQKSFLLRIVCPNLEKQAGTKTQSVQYCEQHAVTVVNIAAARTPFSSSYSQTS